MLYKESYLPFREERVYEYMCHLRNTACAASRGATFVGTLGFVKDVLGVPSVESCLSSSRVKGASLEMYLNKRPLRPAPPLVPAMICVLELASFAERDTHLRALAGFCVACIYGRLRVSDLNRLVHLSVIGDYIEGSLMRVKTSRTKERQCTFLPVIIPRWGLLGIDWFGAFLESRNYLGLEPVPTLESGAAQREFSDTVHMQLYAKVSTTDVTDGMKVTLTSHSLKATVLTYLSKHGCDFTYSELLGYHLTQRKSAINYQRDALAAPVQFMVEVLK